MKRWILNWVPAIIVMAIIFVASSTSGSDIPSFGYLDFLAKKGGHLLGYALLGAASFRAWNRSGSLWRSAMLKASILVALYAVSDEWHQSFTPGRNPSFQDVGIDIVGGILGIVLMSRFGKFFREQAVRKNQNSR
jgi:VanZ family protein